MSTDTDLQGQSAPVGFIKIDGIKGEGWAEQHEGQIAVMSWGWGAEHTSNASSEAGARPKVTMADLKFTTVTSTASPQLMLSCASGRPDAKRLS